MTKTDKYWAIKDQIDAAYAEHQRLTDIRDKKWIEYIEAAHEASAQWSKYQELVESTFPDINVPKTAN